MKRGNFRFVSGLALLCLPLVILAVSCGGGGGDSGGSDSTGTGTMNLSLTDESTTDYRCGTRPVCYDKHKAECNVLGIF